MKHILDSCLKFIFNKVNYTHLDRNIEYETHIEYLGMLFKNKFNLIDLFSNERRNYSFIIRFFDEIKN